MYHANRTTRDKTKYHMALEISPMRRKGGHQHHLGHLQCTAFLTWQDFAPSSVVQFPMDRYWNPTVLEDDGILLYPLSRCSYHRSGPKALLDSEQTLKLSLAVAKMICCVHARYCVQEVCDLLGIGVRRLSDPTSAATDRRLRARG